jgi:tetratricopeptide (TPR) repeat protein
VPSAKKGRGILVDRIQLSSFVGGIMDPKEQFQAIREADQNDQTGYVRHLCERFLQEHPDHGPALLRYSRNLISLGVYAEAQAALDLYTRATRCPEGCIDEAHFNRGGKLLALKRYEEAAGAYREALRLDPDYEIARKRLEDVERILASSVCGASD